LAEVRIAGFSEVKTKYTSKLSATEGAPHGVLSKKSLLAG
jgi:hypothetical protein